MEEAAIPFPREESTPPVTNIYFTFLPFFFLFTYVPRAINLQGKGPTVSL